MTFNTFNIPAIFLSYFRKRAEIEKKMADREDKLYNAASNIVN